MFSRFAVFLALALPLLVRADVAPAEPGPGSVFKAGGACHVSWEGDKSSTTEWKDMAIELMTGSNQAMIHVTMISYGLDGTKDGKFEFPCPEMSPYSAIYFYQFSSPHTKALAWTTRFTIASPAGETEPPEHATQGTPPQDIPWGVGRLKDESKMIPGPVFNNPTVVPTGAGGNSTSGTETVTTAPASSMVSASSGGVSAKSTGAGTTSNGAASSQSTTSSLQASSAIPASLADLGQWIAAACTVVSVGLL